MHGHQAGAVDMLKLPAASALLPAHARLVTLLASELA